MYLLVISLDTIDSLIGSNLKAFRSYGGDDMEMETFGDDDDFVGCIRSVGFEMGVPWKEEEVSKGESFWDFVEREVRVVAMVAMMNDSAFGCVLRASVNGHYLPKLIIIPKGFLPFPVFLFYFSIFAIPFAFLCANLRVCFASPRN